MITKTVRDRVFVISRNVIAEVQCGPVAGTVTIADPQNDL